MILATARLLRDFSRDISANNLTVFHKSTHLSVGAFLLSGIDICSKLNYNIIVHF